MNFLQFSKGRRKIKHSNTGLQNARLLKLFRVLQKERRFQTPFLSFFLSNKSRCFYFCYFWNFIADIFYTFLFGPILWRINYKDIVYLYQVLLSEFFSFHFSTNWDEMSWQRKSGLFFLCTWVCQSCFVLLF